MAKTNNHRRFPGESCRCRPDGASARREEAKQRQEQYDALTPQQRLEKLDMKFGAGQGAKKEREKLMRLSGKPAKKEVAVAKTEAEELITATIPAELMAEIDAMNEELGSKKKAKAKERRSRGGKTTN